MTVNDKLFDFIKQSPTAFHAVSTIKGILREAGFTELNQAKEYDVKPGGRYYVTKNGSSVIAFTVGSDLSEPCFMISASHSDSPAFKVKTNAELTVNKKYTRLNTEGYGGMLCSTWFDRPLSLAGRLAVKNDEGIKTELFNVDRNLLIIPNMAIHFNRNANKGVELNLQKDMLPLFSEGEKSLFDLIERETSYNKEDILSADMFLYCRTEPSEWGADNEFISSPRLDDLQCAFSTLMGFIEGSCDKNINVYACLDNEEVGSGSKQGALSDFLTDTLKRTVRALGLDEAYYSRAVTNGFMVSADNAHAVHPNHPEKTDDKNCTYMNEGIVVKSNSSLKYTTDAVSMALFKTVCNRAGVPLQYFHNRSDEAGGSTLGNLVQRNMGINSVDVGIPQLAMHSAYETAGSKDTEYMIKAVKELYDSHMSSKSDGIYAL